MTKTQSVPFTRVVCFGNALVPEREVGVKAGVSEQRVALCEGFAALLFVAFGAGCCAHVSGEDAVQSRQNRVVFAACHVDGSGVGGGFEDPHDLRDGVVQLVRD